MANYWHKSTAIATCSRTAREPTIEHPLELAAELEIGELERPIDPQAPACARGLLAAHGACSPRTEAARRATQACFA